MKNQSLHNFLRITAIVLLFVVSLNALAAGYSFIVEPSGKGLGITTEYLKPSAPFKDYLIPGIILFTVNGVLSSIIAVLAIIKQKHYPVFIVMQGCILSGWIAVQLTMVTNFHPLHAIIASIGLILIATGLVLRESHKVVEHA
jgi:hypothetical protein